MRGRTYRNIAIVALLLATTAAWLASNGPWQTGVAAPTVLRVGLYENPPKIYVDDNGRPAGLFVELLDAIAAQEGWTLDYRHCDWAACMQQLQAGQLDLMPDVAYTNDRAQRFDFPEFPIVHSWNQAFRRADSPPIRSIADLADRRVALLRGSVQKSELDTLLGGLGLRWIPVPADDFDAAFAAVRDGRADAVVSNNFFGARAARRFGLLETSAVFSPNALYVAAAHGHQAHALARIDYWISRWQQEPDSAYFRAIRRAMMPPPRTVLPHWLPAAVAVAIVVVLVLIAFALLLRWRVRVATREAEHIRAKLMLVMEVSPVALLLLHEQDGRLQANWVSPNVRRLYGFRPEQVMQPGWWQQRMHAEDRATLKPALEYLRRQPLLTREYRLMNDAGDSHYIHEELNVIPGPTGTPLRALATWTDLSEAKAHAAELTRLAHYDALTDLPNRKLLQLFLDDATRQDAPLAVLIVDLDRLRGINDTLGHALGDQALRAAAQRLQAQMPRAGFLARLGGDEFAVVLPDFEAAQAETFAQDVLASFAQPLLDTDPPTVLTACIGIALHPVDGIDTNADTLLRHAELALYGAKQQGSGRRQFFDPALSAGASQRLVLENGLRMAMARREFRLHYQPQVRLDDGSLVGMEALLRWEHPELGMVSPSQFIPIAEEAGLIEDIGHWVLIEACRQLRAWDDAGLHVPSMSVNCSVEQLNAERLPAQLARVLAATGLAAERLELEITESVLMKDPEHAIVVLQALKAQGIRLAIDDFGTGYSSLAYLRRLPLTRLKIDRAFVSGIDHDASAEEICRTVISLAHNLGLETLAEGVEHAHEADFLRNEGCALAQGYHYARPLPPSALAEWLEQRRARAAA